MESPNLLDLRELCTQQRVMLCFNGPISKNLIEEFGTALKNYLDSEQLQASSVIDVFSVYIEMTQNIRHYTVARGYAGADATATVVISHEDDGRYAVMAGNLVEAEDGQRLCATLEGIAALDKEGLKAAYKKRLREPVAEGAVRSGAGLGLYHIARKSSQPLAASLKPQPDGRVFFCLRATV
jgi:hypothetical protein